MTSRDFCFWLQGFFEMRGGDDVESITAAQADLIQRHLGLVFIHEIDPSAGPAEHQKKLNEAHAPKPQVLPPSNPHPLPFGHDVRIRC